eukprot:s3421_g4.t2
MVDADADGCGCRAGDAGDSAAHGTSLETSASQMPCRKRPRTHGAEEIVTGARRQPAGLTGDGVTGASAVVLVPVVVVVVVVGLLILACTGEVTAACQSAELDFIVQAGDAVLAAIEDDVRADLGKLGITVNTRFLEKDDS